MKNRVEQKIIGLLVFVLAVIITTVSASAAINPQINFQGKITNPDGTNISNGSYSIRFRLYTSPTLDGANACGANSCSWEETKSVTVTDGIFQTALGDTTTLPGSVDFNTNNIYLGIKVGTDAEMTPRVRFTASPYAFNAEKVGGLSVSQLVQLSPGSQQTGSINISGSITTASTVAIQGANALTLGSTTNVGAILFRDGTVNNRTITMSSPALAASYNLSLPTSAPAVSQCLQSGPSTASQLVFGACGTPTSLQLAYTTSGSTNPQIALSATGGGLKIQDASTPISGNLFSVANNGGTTNYLSVSTTQITIGTVDANSTLLVLDTDSDATDPTGVDGAMYYNSNLSKFRCYQAGAWENCITPSTSKFIVKGTAENVISSTALQNDDELFFTMGPNEVWAFEFRLLVANTNNAGPDWRSAIFAGGSSSCNVTLSGIEPAGTAFPQISTTDCLTPAILINATILADVDAYNVSMQGRVTAGAAGGTVMLRWAQNTSTAANLTVRAGSYVLAQKVGGS